MECLSVEPGKYLPMGRAWICSAVYSEMPSLVTTIHAIPETVR